MHKKIKTALTINIVNLFGGLGYISCAVQWLWGVLLYSNVIQTYIRSVTPVVEKPVIEAPTIVIDGAAETLFLILGTILSIAVIVLFIYLAIKTPTTIVKTATKVVENAAESVVPTILRIEKKADTPTNRKHVVVNVKLLIKCIFVVVPFIGSLISLSTHDPVFSATVVLYSSSILLLFTTVLFAIQYVLAKALKVDSKKLW